MRALSKSRKYNISDAALAQLCDKVSILLTRDVAEFAAWNFKATDLTNFNNMIEAFKNFGSDEFFEGERMEKTEQKYARRNELIEAITPVRDRIRLVFGENSAVYRSLRITELTKESDEAMIFTSKRVLNTGESKKSELAAKGLTTEMLTTLESAIQNLDQAIDAVRTSNMNRDEQTEARIDLGNALYAETVAFCSMGKSIWYSRSEAKYNDYVIYVSSPGKASLTGKVTDQATGAAIAGAVVELSDVDITEETDEQGNYLFTDLEPGTYTLTVSTDEYNEFSKEGLILHKGETLTENVGLVASE